jgi:hypothetical protein
MQTNQIIEVVAGAMDTTLARVHPWAACDEIAVCFGDKQELRKFVKEAIDDYALEHFNSVQRDTMKRQDKRGKFDVRFEFLRIPGRKWRIEAMCILDGEAPLHERRLAANEGAPFIIHLSYKLGSLDEYQKEVRQLWHLGPGWHREAEYMNSYGMFSYFKMKGDPMFLKPRVNLRDV